MKEKLENTLNELKDVLPKLYKTTDDLNLKNKLDNLNLLTDLTLNKVKINKMEQMEKNNKNQINSTSKVIDNQSTEKIERVDKVENNVELPFEVKEDEFESWNKIKYFVILS